MVSSLKSLFLTSLLVAGVTVRLILTLISILTCYRFSLSCHRLRTSTSFCAPVTNVLDNLSRQTNVLPSTTRTPGRPPRPVGGGAGYGRKSLHTNLILRVAHMQCPTCRLPGCVGPSSPVNKSPDPTTNFDPPFTAAFIWCNI